MGVKRRRVLIVLAGVLLAAVLVTVFWPREKEPEYQGRRLSEWLEQYCTNEYSMNFMFFQKTLTADAKRRAESKKSEAAVAVRHIGTNAIPFLLRWIAYEPKPYDRTPWVIRYHLPHWFWRFQKGQPHVPRNMYAAQGFLILGTDASGCLPELAVLHSRKGTQVSMAAGNVLGFFGYNGDAIPVLVRALDHPDPRIRVEATNALLKVAPMMLTNGVSGR